MHRHEYIDGSLSAGPYVAAVLEEADPPRELIQVNGVNFIKLTSTQCRKLMPHTLIYTFTHVRIYSGNRYEPKTTSVRSLMIINMN